MLSMTGYGRAEYSENGINLTVELKTVNNRIFDLNCKTPRAFIALEDMIRKTINQYVKRGRIDLFVNFSDLREKSSNLEINIEKAVAYYNAAVQLSTKLNLVNDISVSQLLKSPDVVSDCGTSDLTEIEEIVRQTVKQACENLNEMRKIEGDKLVKDLHSRMNTIEHLRLLIRERAPMVAEDYREKLKVRIQEALVDVKYDESRLLNEVAFYTDRVNIDEELTRLGSHISQFRQIIQSEGAGKKLDFLMQEFNRETNTICSKSNDIEVTGYALSLKNEIEKVREQVQNLE